MLPFELGVHYVDMGGRELSNKVNPAEKCLYMHVGFTRLFRCAGWTFLKHLGIMNLAGSDYFFKLIKVLLRVRACSLCGIPPERSLELVSSFYVS